MLDAIEIAGLDITADALLTQRELASYLVARGAHYHFTVKGNQPTLQENIALLFDKPGRAHYTEISPPDHGRIETRRIWCCDQLNDYLDFPHVGQVFLIERAVIHKKSGRQSTEQALGVTSRTSDQTSPADILRINRGHWAIENSCHHVLDMTWDEDRCRIRTGPWPREHLAPAPLRHQRDQPACQTHRDDRLHHAQARRQNPPRLRLPAHDLELHRPSRRRLNRGEQIYPG